jgi:glycosyltransferase involved in cell wall biosynthesis
VAIPTRNSGRVIGRCLESLRRQTYPHLEVLVVDGSSRDGTCRVAAAYGATVVPCPGGLLAARYQGVLRARGQYVLMLDSDQVLEPTAVERAVALMEEGHDMLVLEERSLPPRNWLQRLFAAHRRLVHRYLDERALNPFRGTVLPRFFRRDLLLRAFERVPPDLLPRVVHHDHAIIYLECWRLSRRVGYLPRAVYHQEPASLREAWQRNFRYGRSLAVFAADNPYAGLARRRDGYIWPRRLSREDIALALQSALLLTLLKAAQGAGLLWERARR